MADQFVAEIRVFPFNFAPTGWAFCDGQLMPISRNTALFSLLGTFYGGDGKSTFGLPNMQGNLAISYGQGPGLQLYDIGETGGSETVTVLTTEMPSHNHNLMSLINPQAGVTSPSNAALGHKTGATPSNIYSASVNPLLQFAQNALSPSGSGLPHNNMMPYLTMNFCIALQGIYPSRS